MAYGHSITEPKFRLCDTAHFRWYNTPFELGMRSMGDRDVG